MSALSANVCLGASYCKNPGVRREGYPTLPESSFPENLDSLEVDCFLGALSPSSIRMYTKGNYFKTMLFETRLLSPRPREATFKEGGVDYIGVSETRSRNKASGP